MKSITELILEGFIPRSFLAEDLGIVASDFIGTSLKTISFKHVILVKIPESCIPFITSQEHLPTLLKKNEDESKYDYVFPISSSKKIGFWR